MLSNAADFIPRSATSSPTRGDAENAAQSTPIPLSDWASTHAYVLLADPGGGKTCAFQQEAEQCGGAYVTASHFADGGAPPTWHNGKPLFIDALDELRAGSSDSRTPLIQVKKKLQELNKPPFRLACREADWRAASDSQALQTLIPKGQALEVLHLNPLSDEDITALLQNKGEPDPEDFVHQARQHGLDELLRNPLLLTMLSEVVQANGAWPRSRADLYDKACQKMASEHNAIHREAQKTVRPQQEVLNEAGWLCAVLLLADFACWDVLADAHRGDRAALACLPTVLPIGNKDALAATLSTKLFTSEGSSRWPRHRSIAEYLAAQVLGAHINARKLPLSRLRALMTGFDGGTVESLRGLHGWLSLTCMPESRANWIRTDAVACLLYGDVHPFSVDEKKAVCSALQRLCDNDPYLIARQWEWRHAWKALGTLDMQSYFAEELKILDRQGAHQGWLCGVLEVIEQGEPISSTPGLAAQLECVVRDTTFWPRLRTAALSAWLAHSKGDASQQTQLQKCFDDIRSGVVPDNDDVLLVTLLRALYPSVVTPSEVLGYKQKSKQDSNVYGSQWLFWNHDLLEQTAPQDRPTLADALVASRNLPNQPLEEADTNSDEVHRRSEEHFGFAGRIVAAALNVLKEPFDAERVGCWLTLGLSRDGWSHNEFNDQSAISIWLEQHPNAMKAVALRIYRQGSSEREQGVVDLFFREQILYLAHKAKDWWRWQLDIAAQENHEPLVKALFVQAASAAISEQSPPDLSLEDLDAWVLKQLARWPQAKKWLKDVRSEADRHQLVLECTRLQIEESTRREIQKRDQLREQYAPHLEAIASGQALPCVMNQVAIFYTVNHSHPSQGNTPEERVAYVLGLDEPTLAQRYIAGFEATLSRTDLPSVADILAKSLERRDSFYIQLPCLIGAQQAFERDRDAPKTWSQNLVSCLVAFQLTYKHKLSDWFIQLAELRTDWVARVLTAHAKGWIQRGVENGYGINGLRQLAHQSSCTALAQQVLPPLLRDFPLRAKPRQLSILNEQLLPAAVLHLKPEGWTPLYRERMALSCKKLPLMQRMAWLAAGLQFTAHQSSGDLMRLVQLKGPRAQGLADVLMAQWSSDPKIQPPRPLAALVLARLIGGLAPHIAPQTRPLPRFDPERRGHIVAACIHQLTQSEDPCTGDEIQQLQQRLAGSLWRDELNSAQQERALKQRERSHQAATIECIAQTLANQTPAHSKDLAALVIQHLSDLQARLHGDDTNSLQLFWTDSCSGDCDIKRKSQLENTCRDRLKVLLTTALEIQGVILEKEAAHANNTRADLRAATNINGMRKVVPIEIKKESHGKLWTAWQDQLDGKYVTDPAASNSQFKTHITRRPEKGVPSAF